MFLTAKTQYTPNYQDVCVSENTLEVSSKKTL